MPIYTLRTTSGRENIVIDMIYTAVRGKKLGIKTISHPSELKGYIFIEGSPGDIHKAIHGIMHVKGLIEKPVSFAEIQHFFETKTSRIVVKEGDIVEIIGGPFRGEKGRLVRIDKVKDEVTVELLEASIPIPVTISIELIKLVKREVSEAKEGET